MPVLGSGSPKPVVIPISGYAGHRKGETAENMFGKCFRDVTIKSKIIERGGLQKRIPIIRKKLQNASVLEQSAEGDTLVATRPPMPGRYTETRIFKGGNRSFAAANE